MERVSDLRVFLAGEGPNELGNVAEQSGTRGQVQHPGVLDATARKMVEDGWRVAGGVKWKDIRKFRFRAGRSAEANAVVSLVHLAREQGFDALVFSRDSDGAAERARAIEEGIEEAGRQYPDYVRVAGGAAIRQIESWVLAMVGNSRTEKMGKKRIDEALNHLGTGLANKDTEKLVQLIEQSSISEPGSLPPDAHSLRTWCERVKAALGPEGAVA